MEKAFIKVICISKNETELIEDWLQYHSYLVGYHNVILIDDSSTDPHVLDVYEKYKKKGVQFDSITNFNGNNQGIYMSDFIHKYKKNCEWIIPLDTDEFLFSVKHLHEGKDPTDRDNIIEIFQSIAAETTNCMISEFPQSEVDVTSPFYQNYKIKKPARNMIHFSKDVKKSPMTHWYFNSVKSFTRSAAFDKISIGNHLANVKYGAKEIVPIGYFHYHSTGMKDLFIRAERWMLAFGYIQQNDSLINSINNCRKITSGIGHHRIWQYTNIITREFIVQSYLTIQKRLPTIEELNTTMNVYENKTPQEILNFISTNAQEGKVPNVSKEDIEALVFYEKPFDTTNIVTYTALADRLKLIDSSSECL